MKALATAWVIGLAALAACAARPALADDGGGDVGMTSWWVFVCLLLGVWIAAWAIGSVKRWRQEDRDERMRAAARRMARSYYERRMVEQGVRAARDKEIH